MTVLLIGGWCRSELRKNIDISILFRVAEFWSQWAMAAEFLRARNVERNTSELKIVIAVNNSSLR